ncbi:MAG: hypothetical protein ACRENI_03255 [Gemmatimonadaceae bacterium]
MLPIRCGIRHLAFFEALADFPEGSETGDEWRAVAAGVVVLRLLDSWMDRGAEELAANCWPMKAAMQEIGQIPVTRPERRILTAAVDAMKATSPAVLGPVGSSVMAYARLLDFQARWPLAADVYGTVVEHAHARRDAELIIEASMRMGYCYRVLGQIDSAAEAYGRAEEVATRIRDMSRVLRARVADAKLAIERGNLPRAEKILDATIRTAERRKLGGVRAIALHDRAAVAHLRGDYELAIRTAYEAYVGTREDRERHRILLDIAASFAELGVLSAARDAHMIIARRAAQQDIRWIAMLNLLELAVMDHCELEFDRRRHDLVNVELPPALKAGYHLFLGKGYTAFGRIDQARHELNTAVGIATHYQFNQLLFDAEAALSALKDHRVQSRVESCAPAESVKQVAIALSDMRALAEVG